MTITVYVITSNQYGHIIVLDQFKYVWAGPGQSQATDWLISAHHRSCIMFPDLIWIFFPAKDFNAEKRCSGLFIIITFAVKFTVSGSWCHFSYYYYIIILFLKCRISSLHDISLSQVLDYHMWDITAKNVCISANISMSSITFVSFLAPNRIIGWALPRMLNDKRRDGIKAEIL